MDTYTYLSENQISKNFGISNKNKKGKKKKKKKQARHCFIYIQLALPLALLKLIYLSKINYIF